MVLHHRSLEMIVPTTEGFLDPVTLVRKFRFHTDELRQLTAVTLDLMPCQKDLVSYWFWVVSVFHTRIMLSPTPSARHPVPTGEKVRA